MVHWINELLTSYKLFEISDCLYLGRFEGESFTFVTAVMSSVCIMCFIHMIFALQWIKSFVSAEIKANMGKGAWKISQDAKGTQAH